MVSVAEERDREYLIALWREAFSEESYAVYFYDTVSFKDIFVWREKGQVVSMLHFLPCSFAYGQKIYQGVYMYALATSLQHRKKGIMEKLIEAAKKRAEKENMDFLCLVAANPKLCGYYENFGFHTVNKAEERARLDFSPHIKKYVLWERMQEEKTENNSVKEEIMDNQMIYGLREIPFCKFFGEIPY